MKVNRDGSEEKNKTTAFWLYEFGYDLAKNAQNVDYLRDYLNSLQKNKKFSSIEEKLADIRSRVGLDLATKISNELNHENHKDASEACQCDNNVSKKCHCEVKTAESHSSHTEREISIMKNILDYIRDMIKSEPYLNAAIIISRCKSEEALHFDHLQKKIDHGKLINYINDLLNKEDPIREEKVQYTPSIIEDQFDAHDISAEYYNHAEPSHY